jgi:putative toxin-antitoxin system antitoxin component (TIGR02293 family)
MLANYDAKAIADVLGIAFLREPDSDPAYATRSAKGMRGAKPVAGTVTADFVIDVAHDRVLIVELKSNNCFARFDKSTTGTHRIFAFKADSIALPSPVLIEKAVENGLPRLSLRRVAEQLAGDDKAKISSLEWGVVPKTTLERRAGQLSPQESERTERVARLFVHARRALGTGSEAREFMTTPHPQLDGRRPIEAAKTDLGTRRTEQILNALEYGLAL